jgi:hypothetical protein
MVDTDTVTLILILESFTFAFFSVSNEHSYRSKSQFLEIFVPWKMDDWVSRGDFFINNKMFPQEWDTEHLKNSHYIFVNGTGPVRPKFGTQIILIH